MFCHSDQDFLRFHLKEGNHMCNVNLNPTRRAMLELISICGGMISEVSVSILLHLHTYIPDP
jgi:hypothetical protein